MNWKLDNNHDLLIPLQNVGEVEELVQRIKVALLTYYNEWFANRELGVDYITTVFRKFPDLAGLTNEIRKVLSGFAEITEILDIKIQKIGITYNITILINSIYNKNTTISFFLGGN